MFPKHKIEVRFMYSFRFFEEVFNFMETIYRSLIWIERRVQFILFFVHEFILSTKTHHLNTNLMPVLDCKFVVCHKNIPPISNHNLYNLTLFILYLNYLLYLYNRNLYSNKKYSKYQLIHRNILIRFFCSFNKMVKYFLIQQNC